MADNTSGPQVSESLARLRNDHELFLEDYEKPSQIYRFLKGRHALKPIFLQRNLSYMQQGRRRGRPTRPRSRKSLECISERVKRKRKNDFPTLIQSDNQLQINFQSIEKQSDWSNKTGGVVGAAGGEGEGDGLPDGSMMQVEVLLCCFKQPSAEALLATRPSLPIQCSSLGSFSVRYSDQSRSSPSTSSSIVSQSLNIPASWLSWRAGDTFSTHMLIFRASLSDTPTKKRTPTKRSRRKRESMKELAKRQAKCVVEDCRSKKGTAMLSQGLIDAGRLKLIHLAQRPRRVASSVQLPNEDVHHSPVTSPTYPLSPISNGFTDIATQRQVQSKQKETRDIGVMTDISLGTKRVEMTFSPLKVIHPQLQTAVKSSSSATCTSDDAQPARPVKQRPLASMAVAKKSGKPIVFCGHSLGADTGRRIAGKRMPHCLSSDSSDSEDNRMIVSIPQNVIQPSVARNGHEPSPSPHQPVSTVDNDRLQDLSESNTGTGVFKKRRELQLLLDGNKPKDQRLSLQEIPVFQAEDINSRQTAHSNRLWGSSTRKITPVDHFNFPLSSLNSRKTNPRKRQADASPSISRSPSPATSLLNSSPKDHTQPPPAKRLALSPVHSKPNSSRCSESPAVPTSTKSQPSLTPPSLHVPPSTLPRKELFFADLVAFDSRQQCLLADGSYELLLRQCGHHRDNDRTTTPLSWESILRGNKKCDGVSTKQGSSCLVLKLSLSWLGGPPKTRTEEASDTCQSLIKLNKEYRQRFNMKDGSTTEPTTQGNPTSFPRPQQSMVFNFLYNKSMLQQTELRHHLACPWCALSCPSILSLLHHMSLCHPRFLFTYSQPVDGTAMVDVRLNKMYSTECSVSDDPCEQLAGSLMRRRRQPNRCPSFTAVLATRNMERLDFDHFTGVKPTHRPKLSRVFYHSQTCLPFLPDEIDKDSEEEDAPEWLKTTTKKMLDEFTDVNSGEKQFMKLWNCYLMEHRVIADKQLPDMCVQFAQCMRDKLTDHSISAMFLSHLIYLCDTGLVSPTCIKQCMNTLRGHS